MSYPQVPDCFPPNNIRQPSAAETLCPEALKFPSYTCKQNRQPLSVEPRHVNKVGTYQDMFGFLNSTGALVRFLPES